MSTEMELTLEQTQQGVSYEVSKDSILSGNPVKEILLKLNLPDHRSILTDAKRILKDGGEVLNLKKDATLKLSKSTNQKWYEYAGPEVTRSQDDKMRLCLVDDLTVLKIISSLTSKDKGTSSSLNSKITTTYSQGKIKK
ncbi:hypothetical protein Tco_0702553 [Tanacetum coccineum]|uniref:Uncharacterized protein n=1 Tax=Tanacetum coccineum TaxID=301880 RepID=A0ABQ4XXM4_9ASTR